MQFYIPEIGTIITLAEPWEFTVANDKRNKSIAMLQNRCVDDWYYPFGTKESDELADHSRYGRKTVPIEPGKHAWPAGTTLEVDRIYIRQGNEDYSSVTFKTRVGGKVVRFFAHINDVNKMVF